MKLNNIILRIRRFFNNKNRYKYRNDVLWIPSEKPIIGNKKASFFDPCFVFLDKRKYIFASNRKDNSISQLLLDNHLNVTDCINVLCGFDNVLVNRPCVLKIDQIIHMWFTVQKDRFSYIYHATLNCGVDLSLNDATVVIRPALSFEKTSVMNPCVIFEDGVFKMWYACGSQYEPDCIAYAESADGINWTKRNAPVLTKSERGFDSFKVGACDIKKAGLNYVMFYIGYENIDLARICTAFSADGINWIKDSVPLFSPVKKTWYSDACYKPSFFYDENRDISYLFFNGRSGGTESIGFIQYKGDFLKTLTSNYKN